MLFTCTNSFYWLKVYLRVEYQKKNFLVFGHRPSVFATEVIGQGVNSKIQTHTSSIFLQYYPYSWTNPIHYPYQRLLKYIYTIQERRKKLKRKKCNNHQRPFSSPVSPVTLALGALTVRSKQDTKSSELSVIPKLPNARFFEMP